MSSVLKKAFGVKARRRKSASRRCGLRLEYLVFEEGRAARGIIARALGSGIIRIKKFLLRERYKKKKHKPSRARDERREKRRRKGTTEDAPSARIECVERSYTGSRPNRSRVGSNGVVCGIPFFILFCVKQSKTREKVVGKNKTRELRRFVDALAIAASIGKAK